jgi:hypothetical protein
MTTSFQIISQFIQPLENLKIKYVVTGSIASIIYGNPRLTHDIDLVINIEKAKAKKFLDCFDSTIFYVPPLEIFQLERQREAHGHVNIIHLESGFKADLYFCGTSEIHLWALNNYSETKFYELQLRIAPIEYVIIQKMLFYKEAHMQKHIIDITGMLEESKDLVDFSILRDFIKKNSLEEVWETFFQRNLSVQQS